MLELRPSCEQCNCALPPESSEAMICSFECTYCRECVAQVLHNVCPNCGGGFEPRPVRPRNSWHDHNDCAHYPPAIQVRHRPVDPAAHAEFAAPIEHIPPAER